MNYVLLEGDCLEVLKGMDSDTVDSLVTDPPAGISFMGKAWDGDKGGRKQWIAWLAEVMKESFRVMKPGAHGLVWAIPRTSHWTATACEEAGFEIRDVVTHLFGSGFPKSMDISKAIDKAAGAEREIVGLKTFADGSKARKTQKLGGNSFQDPESRASNLVMTAPSTSAAKQWQGWGTALKPASEHWILVRKPCSEKTVAANVLKWGVGGINIGGSRVGNEPHIVIGGGKCPGGEGNQRLGSVWNAVKKPVLGRFPANLVLDEEGAQALDDQAGNNYSRFFYVAKPSKRERNAGCEGLPVKTYKTGCGGEMPIDDNGNERDRFQAQNHHPTVKPTTLMRYLIKLITPPDGVVLDPFAGSGTTGVAALEEGMRFLGIEKEQEYLTIAEARCAHANNKEK